MIGRRRPRRPSRRLTAGVAFAIYLAFALSVTWPWLLDPNGRLFGVMGGDLTSDVALFQQLAEDHQPPFLPGQTTQVNAPEGSPTDWPVQLAAVGSSATRWLLSMAIGSVPAHGLVAVLGFALSAFAMFLLARAVTGHQGAAFVAGVAFGFWPFMYGTGFTWPHYIHLWVLVVLVWRMLVVTEEPTRRNGLFAGGATVLAMTWIQYNLLIADVLFATLAVVALLRAIVRHQLKEQLVAQSIAAGIVVVALAGLLGAAALSEYERVPTRTTADAVLNSARPAMYVVPGPRHPLVGDDTAPWLYERFAPTLPEPIPGKAIYADIYLGVPLVLIALAGAVWTLVGLGRGPRAAIAAGPTAVGLTAVVLGAVALAFSAPPKVSVFGVLVPMPYSILEHATTVFRVAHRFAVVVMLSVCLLAALAIAAFLRGRTIAVQIPTLAALALVFAVDLRAMPSPSTTKVTHPAIYDLLRRQPPGILAEYPPEDLYAVNRLRSFYQDTHEHPLFAGAPVDSDAESRKLELQYLLAPRTVPDLAEYGVKYVIVHRVEPPLVAPGQAVSGLRAIGGDAEAVLYRVVGAPSRFTSYGAHGFHRFEGDQAGGGRWVGQNGAELELRGRCDPCAGTVSFQAASLAEPRRLRIEGEDGRTLFQGIIGTYGGPVRFAIRFASRTVVRLSTDPPPVPVSSVLPSPDNRSVSVFVAQPIRFEPNRRSGNQSIP
jgi:hypothetical protein